MFDRSATLSMQASSGAVRRTTGSCGRIATAVLLLVASPALGQTRNMCQPKVSVTASNLSEMRGVTRIWRATVTADARACVNKSGAFTIEFVRLLEHGPDDSFVEKFQWEEGASEIELDFSLYESVLSYRILVVEPCPCQR